MTQDWNFIAWVFFLRGAPWQKDALYYYTHHQAVGRTMIPTVKPSEVDLALDGESVEAPINAVTTATSKVQVHSSLSILILHIQN